MPKKKSVTQEDVVSEIATQFGGGEEANKDRALPTSERVEDSINSPHVRVFVKKLPHYGDLPNLKPATHGSVGIDLFAAVDEPVCLNTLGARAMIPTGIAIALPVGFEAQIRPRSGLAAKNGISVLNTPGTIDCIPLHMSLLCSDGSYRTLEEIIQTKTTQIKSFNQETNDIEDDYINDIWNVGDKETLVITFDDDTTLEITKTQLVLTNSGWKTAKDLTMDDHIISV